MTRQRNDSSATPCTMTFYALFAEWGDFKNRCEALALESQCIPTLAAEAKNLRRKVAERDKIRVVTKTTLKA